SPAPADVPVDAQATESGFRLHRHLQTMSLVRVTWLFLFMYVPSKPRCPSMAPGSAHQCWRARRLLDVLRRRRARRCVADRHTRTQNIQRVTLLIVAGWWACLLPFVFAPVGVTLVCFAPGRLLYGPFIPLTYALFKPRRPTRTCHGARSPQRYLHDLHSRGPAGWGPAGRNARRGTPPHRLRRRRDRLARHFHWHPLDAPEAATLRRLGRMICILRRPLAHKGSA